MRPIHLVAAVFSALVVGTATLASPRPGVVLPPISGVQDEGSLLPFEPYINFTGAGVSCVDDPSNTRTTCTVSGGGGSSPLTTKGDLYTRDSTSDTRLPVGADGLCLVADSAETTGLKWASCSSGGGLTYSEVRRLVFLGGN